MGVRWIKHITHFSLLVTLVVFLEIKVCSSLNSEGLALLEFRASVDSDPHGVLANWDPNHDNPCKWSGVYCVDQKVQILVLSKNHFSGFIPKTIGDQLTMLEVLDLRDNRLNGIIPVELTGLRSLKQLFIDNNVFDGEIPSEISLRSKQGSEKNGCLSRKHGLCVWMSNNKQKPLVDARRRRLLAVSNGNLAAIPANGGSPLGPIVAVPISRSSGSFPSSLSPSSQSTQNGSTGSNTAVENESGGIRWKCIALTVGSFILLIVVVVMIFLCRSKAVPHIVPWKTGLSGQLQKAFVTGVPKLNQGELQSACEDFSNIIDTIEGCTLYKGTLSSGVEIAVASTEIVSAKDWSRHYERAYRKKIDMLCRVNHKNFVNLIGFCEEQQPFTRMMVFEYTPNGRLSEHLHVKELEHLDWNMRTRIIMGIAYCLQYMHELNPSVTHSNLTSKHIYLTDDYAAKVAEVCFGKQTIHASRNPGDEDSSHSALLPSVDPETNVYNFGIILLEIISGKIPFEESGDLHTWVAEYLSGKQSINAMIDPTLESFKNGQLVIIGEVIMLCTQGDPKKRPSMKDIISKLREVISITPEQAVARLSPLWWAELEILSSEAA